MHERLLRKIMRIPHVSTEIVAGINGAPNIRVLLPSGLRVYENNFKHLYLMYNCGVTQACMFVCVYVCVCVYIYYIYICVYVCVCVYLLTYLLHGAESFLRS